MILTPRPLVEEKDAKKYRLTETSLEEYCLIIIYVADGKI